MLLINTSSQANTCGKHSEVTSFCNYIFCPWTYPSYLLPLSELESLFTRLGEVLLLMLCFACIEKAGTIHCFAFQSEKPKYIPQGHESRGVNERLEKGFRANRRAKGSLDKNIIRRTLFGP